MELSKADEDTRIEVDLMILDYLVSTTLESALYAQTSNRDPVDTDAIDWHTDIIERSLEDFKSSISKTELMPQDTQTRLRLLGLTNALFRIASPAVDKMELLLEFSTICSRSCRTTAEPQWTGVGAQLIAQIAIEVSLRTGRPLKDTLAQSTAQVDEHMKREIGHKATANYPIYLQPPTGTPLHNHIEQLSGKLGPAQLKNEICRILLDIAKKQDAPLLIQLERGKLRGLSRAETLQLKERVGIR